MKSVKILGLAAVAAMALTSLGASNASATTIEINGVTQNTAVTITLSLEEGTSMIMSRTDGSLAGTCSESHAHGATTVLTGSKVTGPLSSLSVSKCSRPLTVHKPGQLYIEHEAGTTNGTVLSEESEVTMSTAFGTVNCKTGAGTDIGTLSGATTASNPSAHATLQINAVTNCGFLLPSAMWKGSYSVTSPTDLAISA